MQPSNINTLKLTKNLISSINNPSQNKVIYFKTYDLVEVMI